MIPAAFDYVIADSADAAVTALAEHGDDAKKKYVRQLTLLHGMLIQTMKAKQTTDLAHIKQLNELIDKFEEAYLGHTH